ncbi:hypothetical protein M2351_006475 [Azospirillum canadense]|nr:hypothetical protein [Azospirillum canadense]
MTGAGLPPGARQPDGGMLLVGVEVLDGIALVTIVNPW